MTAVEDCLAAGTRGRYARPRAFSLGIQVIGYAHSGEVERACAACGELLDVAGRLGSGRLRARVAEVVGSLEPYRREPAVRTVMVAASGVLDGRSPSGLADG